MQHDDEATFTSVSDIWERMFEKERIDMDIFVEMVPSVFVCMNVLSRLQLSQMSHLPR